MSNCVLLDTVDYPKQLKSLRNPPKNLYYKGFWNNDLFNECIAVVGSREVTAYGKVLLNVIFKDLVGTNVTIVSGFMRGIDTEAHKLALEYNLKTIAVLPGGIDYIVPSENFELYNKIIESESLVLSEHPGNIAPRKWSFPKRNRIVAGLSLGVLVVEARKNSGSLITAKYCKNLSRILMTIPGDVFNVSYSGNNFLLKSGALPITTGKDMLALLNIKVSETHKNLINNFSKDQKLILNALKDNPMHFDTLLEATNLSPSVLSIETTSLCVAGVVFESSGVFYAS
ncbi:MAG: DNA-processing protein DprA [Patescibacteria group bacterium]